MRPYVNIGIVKLASFVGLGVLFIGLFVSLPVFADGSNISAVVCGQHSSSNLVIDQPKSDSVVSRPRVAISGQITNSTQIEILLDGQYNSTIPLTISQTTFQAAVTLARGTHTVTLVPNNICGVQEAGTSVVLTFEPPANVAASDTASSSEPLVTTYGGVTIGGAAANESPATPQETPAPFFNHVAHALDFDSSGREGVVAGTTRVLSISAGVLLLAMAIAVQAGLGTSFLTRFLVSMNHGRLSMILGSVGLTLSIFGFII